MARVTDAAANPFEAYGEANTRAARPSRRPQRGAPHVVMSEKDAPMAPSPMEKQQRQKSAQMSRYRKAKREEHQQMLEGEHGDAYYRMLKIMGKLPDSAADLVDHLLKGWVRKLSAQQRLVVLSMIDRRITLIRERDGRPPWDDPMPGMPNDRPNLFMICRKILTGV
jgi:hypothetical protein